MKTDKQVNETLTKAEELKKTPPDSKDVNDEELIKANADLRKENAFLKAILIVCFLIFFNIIVFSHEFLGGASAIVIGVFELVLLLIFSKFSKHKLILTIWREILGVLRNKTP